MKIRLVHTHPWHVSPEEAVHVQTELAKLVEQQDRLPDPIRTIAGVDVAYEKAGPKVFAAVVVLDAVSLQLLETSSSEGIGQFPYVPGLFSFRELPFLCKALEGLRTEPDLVVCDGQGVAHPRRCGLASHLGILFDVPTIGCGKTCLVGDHGEPGLDRGSTAPLVDRGEVVGSVLRTQKNVKPLFVSVGHRVSLDTACSWILRLAKSYRQPEPIRLANQLANALRARNLTHEPQT